MRRPYLLAPLLTLTLLCLPTALADEALEAPTPPADTADSVVSSDEPVPADPSLEEFFRELDATHGAQDKFSTCPDEGCYTDHDCELALQPPYCQGERKCYIDEPGCPGNCYCTN